MAARVSGLVGSPIAFLAAVALIVMWLLSGPGFGFSDHWQLFIHTVTSVVIFLIVFLIQNAQNRDAKAIHIKLDELLRGTKGARTSLVDIEDLPNEELEKLRKEFKEMHEHYTKELIRRGHKITIEEDRKIDVKKIVKALVED